MCGLTFLFHPALSPDSLRQKTDQAIHQLNHRGPDTQALWSQDGVAMGHCRLAIVDLAASHQPM
ncbi:MAG: asparagine synthetase B, partial [Magnetococcales bacterium]|nr:asparagine synthetase B [Magnetococcales bacterium]